MLKNRTLLVACGVTGLFWSGCGSKPAPAPTPASDPGAAAAPSATPATPSSTAPAATPATSSTPVKNTGGKETKWIGTIPYDVFYDQPLTIASDPTVIGTPAPASVPSPSSSATIATTTPSAPPAMANPGMAPPAQATPAPAATPAAPADTSPASNGAVNWAEQLPMAILLEESKALRTQLTNNLQTVATFNKGSKNVSVDAAILTALACVAQKHPESLPWKENAHFVRDLASEISAGADGTGRGPYTKCKEPFEKLIVVLDGGKPPEMESQPDMPYSEAVNVAEMMKWIEPSFNGLKANFNTAARLKEDPATLERELRVMATLGLIMADSSYDSADQEGYQKLFKRFIDGSNEALAAAKTGDLEGYQAALNKVQTTCAECHQEYRGSGNAF